MSSILIIAHFNSLCKRKEIKCRAKSEKVSVGEAFRLPKTSGYRVQRRAIRESPLQKTIKLS